MILLNFSHPLTPDQLGQITQLTGHTVERVIALPAQFGHPQPFGPQLEALMALSELSALEWQTH